MCMASASGDINIIATHFIYASIDRDYVSRLSITYSKNPCQYIWSFAGGHGERQFDVFTCPCTNTTVFSPPSYVGSNYYCESASWYCCNYNTYYFMTHYGMKQDV